MLGVAGLLVGGRYRLIEPVGRGGMGQVWRARDEMLDRQVAVKEVLMTDSSSVGHRAQLIARTAREARATARLNHRGIVTVHDVVEHAGAPWIVMEFIAGLSLAAIIAREGRLPWERVSVIGSGIIDALEVPP